MLPSISVEGRSGQAGGQATLWEGVWVWGTYLPRALQSGDAASHGPRKAGWGKGTQTQEALLLSVSSRSGQARAPSARRGQCRGVQTRDTLRTLCSALGLFMYLGDYFIAAHKQLFVLRDISLCETHISAH